MCKGPEDGLRTETSCPQFFIIIILLLSVVSDGKNCILLTVYLSEKKQNNFWHSASKYIISLDV